MSMGRNMAHTTILNFSHPGYYRFFFSTWGTNLVSIFTYLFMGMNTLNTCQ
jgi:hypothetical protein